jgi:hypothetical protein
MKEMNQRRDYASLLTKEDLIAGGITNITEAGVVTKGKRQFIPSINKQSGYRMLNIYAVDENGERIKRVKEETCDNCGKVIKVKYVDEQRSIGLHRAIWA